MLDLVLVPKFCELSGYTDDAVRAKISQGKWREGTVWRKAPDGRVLISLRGFSEWAEGRECGQSGQKPSRWTSAGKGNAAANVYDLSQRPPISDTPAT